MTKKTYDEIIAMAPNPEMAEKLMNAMYILSKGQPQVEIPQVEIFRLVDQMSLEELKRNAEKIREQKYKDAYKKLGEGADNK